MLQFEFDIVVVGAGLTGSLSAVALAQCGFKVGLVEKGSLGLVANGNMDGRSLVLSLSSVRVLDELGLWSSIKSEAWPIKKVRVSDQGGFGRLELESSEIQQTELGFACPSSTLLSVFRVAAEASTKITAQEQFQYIECREAVDHIGVMLRSSDPSQEDRCLRAKLLIGADGEKSRVRLSAGISTFCTNYQQSAIVCELSADENLPYVAFEHFTREGPLAMIPTGDKRYVSILCVGSESEKDFLTMSAREYADVLSCRLGYRLGRFSDLGRRFGYPLSAIYAERLFCRRTVLVGDAANRVHPNAAQGLNLGIRDVWFLRRILGPVQDPGASRVLSRYSECRKNDHAKTRALSKGLAIIFRSSNMFLSGARRLALGTMGLSARLRRRFLLGATGLSEISPRYD